MRISFTGSRCITVNHTRLPFLSLVLLFFFYPCFNLFAFSFYKYLFRAYCVLITLLLVRKTKINNSLCPQGTNNPMRNGETYAGKKKKNTT